jgi:hypothetical protein
MISNANQNRKQEQVRLGFFLNKKLGSYPFAAIVAGSDALALAQPAEVKSK